MILCLTMIATFLRNSSYHINSSLTKQVWISSVKRKYKEVKIIAKIKEHSYKSNIESRYRKI